MLILSRQIGEAIVVDDDVIVTVLGVKGNQVQIGVNAPKELSVHREEIYQRIQAEKCGKDVQPRKADNQAFPSDSNRRRFEKEGRPILKFGNR